MDDHRQIGEPIAPRGPDSVSAVAYGVLEGRPAAVLAGSGLTVWDLRDRLRISRIVGAKIRPYPSWRSPGGAFGAVACTRLEGRLVAVTGSYDGTVRIWDVLSCEQIGEPLCGHESVIRSVACGVLHGRPAVLTVGDDCTVRIWDLASREQVGQPLTGHTDVACGLLDGRPIAVSASSDQTVRVWDLNVPAPVGTPLAGHDDRVGAVALAMVAGRLVAVSGGDGTLRVWDLRTCRQVGPPLFDGRNSGLISSVACGTLHGRPVALTAYRDGIVRVWDLEEHRRMGFDAPARFAAELPMRWTDPANGDVYDLSRPPIDEEGGEWEYLDFDGFEPIVAQQPVDRYVTLGISHAHFGANFCDVVTPGPRRWHTRSVRSIGRQYYEFQITDGRVLSKEQKAVLAERYPLAKLTKTRMIVDYDPRHDDMFCKLEADVWEETLRTSEFDELMRTYFDSYLEFKGCNDPALEFQVSGEYPQFPAVGGQCLQFRLPAALLAPAALSPYLARDVFNGLSSRVEGNDVFIGFYHHEEYYDFVDWDERPDARLKPLLPLRADLANGDLSSAYIGWLKAVQETKDRDDLEPPPRPATFQAMSPQLRALAGFLDLNSWARERLP
jgi:WD40 repeat protein